MWSVFVTFSSFVSSSVSIARDSFRSSSTSRRQLVDELVGETQAGGGDRRRARSASDGHLSKRCGSARRSASRSRAWRPSRRVARHASRFGCWQETTSLKRMFRLTTCDAVDRATYGKLICTTTRARSAWRRKTDTAAHGQTNHSLLQRLLASVDWVVNLSTLFHGLTNSELSTSVYTAKKARFSMSLRLDEEQLASFTQQPTPWQT